MVKGCSSLTMKFALFLIGAGVFLGILSIILP